MNGKINWLFYKKKLIIATHYYDSYENISAYVGKDASLGYREPYTHRPTSGDHLDNNIQ